MYRVDIAKKTLIALAPTGFASLSLRERFDIQEWIEKTPSILGEELLVVGKEMILASGKRLDLLCIDKTGSLVIVELKRDDSGASIEWQAIKYASYCSKLLPVEIFDQFARYLGKNQHEAAQIIEEFIDADIERINAEQRIILVAREFNSEVISAVLWLREYSVNLQCVRLAPYLDSDQELFIKPEIIIPLPEAKDYIERKEYKQRVALVAQEEWAGFWFVNVGEGQHRTWEDNLKFGFIGAGQGKRYSSALLRLTPGDKLYAYMKGLGYVGYGEVTNAAKPIRDFISNSSGLPLLQSALTAPQADANADDDELCEWAVGVRWINTVPKVQAKTFNGVFANQNVVCKLRHESTLKFVQNAFGASEV